jgi:hypothetical protein
MGRGRASVASLGGGWRLLAADLDLAGDGGERSARCEV